MASMKRGAVIASMMMLIALIVSACKTPYSTPPAATRGSDRRFRAYDRDSGKEVWSMELPAASEGMPATYEVGGRQFIVLPVAAGTGQFAARFGGPAPAPGRGAGAAPACAGAAGAAGAGGAAALAGGGAAAGAGGAPGGVSVYSHTCLPVSASTATTRRPADKYITPLMTTGTDEPPTPGNVHAC